MIFSIIAYKKTIYTMIHDIFMPGFAHPSLPGKIVEWKKSLGDIVTKGKLY